jgi:hypothetical protein
MERHVAEKVLASAELASGTLNDALLLIQKECPDEEFRRYRKGIGLAMGYLYTEVTHVILAEHPDLIPPELMTDADRAAAEAREGRKE